MSNKQTAVEWLEEKINNPNIPTSSILFKQAKEMEKKSEKMYTEEDLRRAYNYGMFAVTSGRSFSDWFKERNK